MISSSSLKPSIPSSTLLRFLRAQSDNLCLSRACERAGQARQRWPLTPQTRQTRKFSRYTHEGVVPCEARVQASLFPTFINRRKTPNTPPHQHDSSLTAKEPKLASGQQSQYSRSTSINGKRPLLRRLLDFRHRNVESKLKPHDLPALTTFVNDDGSEGNLFNLGRTLAAKASNELRLRCTEFDGSGNVTLVNGEYRKSELIAKVHFPIVYSHVYLSLISVYVLTQSNLIVWPPSSRPSQN